MLCHYSTVAFYLVLVGAITITVKAAPALPEVSNDSSKGLSTDLYVVVIRANSSQLHEVARRITLIIGATNNELINATIERNKSRGWIIQAKECDICQEKALESEAVSIEVDVDAVNKSLPLEPVQSAESHEFIPEEIITHNKKHDDVKNHTVGEVNKNGSKLTDEEILIDRNNQTQENDDKKGAHEEQDFDGDNNPDKITTTDRNQYSDKQEHGHIEKIFIREKQTDQVVYISENNNVVREQEKDGPNQITTERNTDEKNEGELMQGIGRKLGGKQNQSKEELKSEEPLEPVQLKESVKDEIITKIYEFITEKNITSNKKHNDDVNNFTFGGEIHKNGRKQTDEGILTDRNNLTKYNDDKKGLGEEQHANAGDNNPDEITTTDRNKYSDKQEHGDDEKIDNREKQADEDIISEKKAGREQEKDADKQITTEKNHREGKLLDEGKQMQGSKIKQGGEQHQSREELKSKENQQSVEQLDGGEQQQSGQHNFVEKKEEGQKSERQGDQTGLDKHEIKDDSEITKYLYQDQSDGKQNQSEKLQQGVQQYQGGKQSGQIQQSEYQQYVKQQQGVEQQQGEEQQGVEQKQQIGEQHFIGREKGQKTERLGDEELQTTSGDHYIKEESGITKTVQEKLEYRVEKHPYSPWTIILAVIGGLIGAFLIYSIVIKILDRSQSAEYRIRE